MSVYQRGVLEALYWLMFSLIITMIFVLKGLLSKLNSCSNWKVRIPIHHVWFMKVYILVSHESYIGETLKNVEIRWPEHEDIKKDSELTKYLKNNQAHSFTWNLLLPVSSNRRIRQNIEISIITLQQPSLNERVESKKLSLFLNSLTW